MRRYVPLWYPTPNRPWRVLDTVTGDTVRVKGKALAFQTVEKALGWMEKHQETK